LCVCVCIIAAENVNKICLLMYTHTHTRLTALFSGTTQVSQYQKGKTQLKQLYNTVNYIYFLAYLYAEN